MRFYLDLGNILESVYRDLIFPLDRGGEKLLGVLWRGSETFKRGKVSCVSVLFKKEYLDLFEYRILGGEWKVFIFEGTSNTLVKGSFNPCIGFLLLNPDIYYLANYFFDTCSSSSNKIWDKELSFRAFFFIF